MIDSLLRRTYIELSQIAWRFRPDTLRRRLLIVVLIQLQRWKIARASAIGRALANGGYAAKGKRPSREEMSKVERLSAKDIAKAKEVPSFATKEEALAADPWSN